MDADDRRLIRELAARLAAAAVDPVNEARFRAWNDLNNLRPGRPLVWINEIPWHEFPDLEPRCRDPRLHGFERWLRTTLHQWAHFGGDMVLEAVRYVGPCVRDSGFGIETLCDESDQNLGARHYRPQIETLADVERIRDPVVSVDEEAHRRQEAWWSEILGDLLAVRRRGITHTWFAPWDLLVQWYGIEQLFTDMVDRPALVHAAIDRLTAAQVAQLEQWERLGLLSTGNGNHRVGSGGLGICDALPGNDGLIRRAVSAEQWGTATGQIFSGVSPVMHEEFCLRYERRWLDRFGLNCYGCCEPLHQKMDLMRSIPRLRRISVSPLADVAVCAEAIGRDYVFSLKPNPADVCAPRFDLETARRRLRANLEVAARRGCVIEIILKDVHTLHGQPERLDAWAAMAGEEADRVAAVAVG